jgi:hypothetical protein
MKYYKITVNQRPQFGYASNGKAPKGAVKLTDDEIVEHFGRAALREVKMNEQAAEES